MAPSRSSLKAPDALSGGDKSSRKYMEKLNDAQIPTGAVMMWSARTETGFNTPLDVEPPLGWLKMDRAFVLPVSGTAYLIREYRELAYSGSSFVYLDEPNGVFYLIDPDVWLFGTNNIRWICKT